MKTDTKNKASFPIVAAGKQMDNRDGHSASPLCAGRFGPGAADTVSSGRLISSVTRPGRLEDRMADTSKRKKKKPKQKKSSSCCCGSQPVIFFFLPFLFFSRPFKVQNAGGAEPSRAEPIRTEPSRAGRRRMMDEDDGDGCWLIPAAEAPPAFLKYGDTDVDGAVKARPCEICQRGRRSRRSGRNTSRRTNHLKVGEKAFLLSSSAEATKYLHFWPTSCLSSRTRCSRWGTIAALILKDPRQTPFIF